MPGHTPKEKRKRKTRSSHNKSFPTPRFDEFDPIDSAADNLADAVMRGSKAFKAQKNKLKLLAKRSLSDSPFKGS